MDGGIAGDPESVGASTGELERAVALLEEQRNRGLHDGAQLFVARRGQVLVDAAVGEAQPGVPLRTDSVMLWLSCTKPLTAVAIGQLLERGLLQLDDRVQAIIPQFAAGKEAATIGHLLTHTAGFPMATSNFLTGSWDDTIRMICEAPAEWEPGAAAGYHGVSSWCILGEIVRRLDGRRIDVYLDEEIVGPLGMTGTTLGVTETRAADLGDRLSHVAVKSDDETLAGLALFNVPAVRALTLPGASGYGSAHDLGRFYLALWSSGRLDGVRILKPDTVKMLTATHRSGMVDRSNSVTFGTEVRPAWGLGFMKGSDDEELVSLRFGSQATAQAYGHGGAMTSVAFVEPTRDLVVVIVTNGFVANTDNTNRLRDVSDAVHGAFTA
jgi:CubicO group peptidase (beta-lactamase class C family)